jgi:hypothetical protein
MLNKNNIQTGVAAGMVLPVTAVLLFGLMFPGKILIGKPAVPYFIAAALNLLLLRYFAHRHHDKTAQGLMLVTFIFLAIVYFFRFKQ